jgi:hypothetical protein
MYACCDANLGSNIDDCWSTSSYVFLLGNGIIFGLTQKNYIVMLLTKIEYMATS